MLRKVLRLTTLAICLVSAAAVFSHADETLIEITDIELDETKWVSFRVDSRTDLRITAVGAERKTDEVMYAYPWIIDLDTRDMVWSMDEEFTRPFEDSKWLCEYDDVLRLNPGTYTLYYHASQPFIFAKAIGIGKSGKMLEDLDKDVQDLLDALGVWLDESGKKRKGDAVSIREMTSKLFVRIAGNPQAVRITDDVGEGRKPVVSLAQPENDAFMSEGFTLTMLSSAEPYSPIA